MRQALRRRSGDADREDLPERRRGVYKFVYGATAAQRTVLRSATDLLLDAMREFDETEREAEENLRNRSRGEGVVMSETETLTAARIPTVYFIDDSATMREVIKIAFRKENIHVDHLSRTPLRRSLSLAKPRPTP